RRTVFGDFRRHPVRVRDREDPHVGVAETSEDALLDALMLLSRSTRRCATGADCCEARDGETAPPDSCGCQAELGAFEMCTVASRAGSWCIRVDWTTLEPGYSMHSRGTEASPSARRQGVLLTNVIVATKMSVAGIPAIA